MLNKAIEKIKAEIVGSKNNPYIQVVGEFLLQYLESNPSSAEKIVQEGKTIGSSLNEMKKEAEKKKVANCAVLTDHEGFSIVLKYFDIKTVNPSVIPRPVEVIQVSDEKPIEFNVELDF